MSEVKAKVILGIEADVAEARRAMNDFLGYANKADEAINDLKREAKKWRDEIGEMFEEGWFKGMRELGARMGAAGGGMYFALDTMTKAMKLFGDESLSTAQKVDTLIRSIPAVGGLYGASKEFTTELLYGNSRRELSKSREFGEYNRTLQGIYDANEAQQIELRRQREQSQIDAALTAMRPGQLAGNLAGNALMGLMGSDPLTAPALIGFGMGEQGQQAAEWAMRKQRAEDGITSAKARVSFESRELSRINQELALATEARRAAETEMGSRTKTGFTW